MMVFIQETSDVYTKKLAILIYILLVLIPHATSVSFDLTKISPQYLNTDIVTQGDVSISNNGLELTPGNNVSDGAGRGTYAGMLHLWDKTSRELTSFSTNFSFVIQSDSYVEGLTFFLAENNSELAPYGALGLPISGETYTMVNPFVAVEFDTYWDEQWDPSNDYHVGINVNSLNSSVFQKWSVNVTHGAHCEASVRYDSVYKNLSVSVTDDAYGVIDLNYVIDMRDVLPEWVIFGFSSGTGDGLENVTVLSWSFSSSYLQVDEGIAQAPSITIRSSYLEVDEGIAQPPSLSLRNEEKAQPPSPSPTTNQNPNPVKDNKRVGLIVGLVVAVVVFIALVGVYYLWRRKNKLKSDQVGYDTEMNKEFEQGTGPKRFSYNEILHATSRFAETNKLGEGGFGGVYKGFLKDVGTFVAVKRVSKTSEQGIKEYSAEVKIISRLRHKNLLELKGWCHEKSELLLIYEYMENGSLDLHLFKNKSLLTWDKKQRISYGLASALLYLHEDGKDCILHMLDSNFNAKLGDFGLAKLVDHVKGSRTTMFAGTLGYMAPEYVITGKPSKESDVFSFGVVALEIACGRKSIEHKAQDRQVKLVEWVWDLYGTGSILEAFDLSLCSGYTEEIERLVIVGLWCAHPHADLRPSMRQVVQVLNSEASLPILPLKMPKITFCAPPTPLVFGDYSSTSGL